MYGTWGFRGPFVALLLLVVAAPVTPALALNGTDDSHETVVLGASHGCITRMGTPHCWGRNNLGQLGLGHSANVGDSPGEMGDAMEATDLGGCFGVRDIVAAMGGDHTCALKYAPVNSALKCWGGNSNGQLGYGDTSARGDNPGEMGDALPAVNLGSSLAWNISRLSLGAWHSCAVFADRSLKCWGTGISGVLGYGDTTNRGDESGEMGDALPFVDLGSNTSILEMCSGWRHNCARLNDSSVKCWGWNIFGQLGQGHTADVGDEPGEMGDALPTVNLGTGRTATTISCGALHTCAILDNGAGKCWGRNSNGQLGYGDMNSRGDGSGEMGDNLSALNLGSGMQLIHLGGGFEHTCAGLLDIGSVARGKCWGGNSNGQLGYGDTSDRGDNPGEMGDNLSTVVFPSGYSSSNITDFLSNGDSSALVFNRDEIYVWGENVNGQLGVGDTLNRGDNQWEMGDNLTVVDLPAPANFSCVFPTAAPTESPSMLPTTTPSSAPSGAPSPAPLVSPAPTTPPTIVPTGTPTATPSSAPTFYPMSMNDSDDDILLAAGESFACAVRQGAVQCWGSNSNGELGYEDNTNRGDGPGEMGDALPDVALGPCFYATMIAAGVEGNSVCAVKQGPQSGLKCWGANSDGQLGYGDTANRGDGVGEMGSSLSTVDLGTGTGNISQLALGMDFSCVLFWSGWIKCFGANGFGQLGYGDIANRGDDPGEMGDALPFVNLGSLAKAVLLAAGRWHVCAILNTGAVKCWGSNFQGQLGQGDTSARGDNPFEMGTNLSYVDLPSGTHAVAIGAGTFHTCVVLNTGDLVCWGQGSRGQLGTESSATIGDSIGEMGDALVAANLGTNRSIYSLHVSSSGTCAILDNAAVKCFGENANGQLGQGDTLNRGSNVGDMGDNLPAINFGSSPWVAHMALGDGFVCAAHVDDSVHCWGGNANGQLGLEDTTSRGNLKWEMGDNLTALYFGAATNFSCTQSPTPAPTPMPSSAPSGTPTAAPSSAPTNTPAPSAFPSTAPSAAPSTSSPTFSFDVPTPNASYNLAMAGYGPCVHRDDPGDIKCWGANAQGQLGQGDTSNRGDEPWEMGVNLSVVDLGGCFKADQISCGDDFCCASKTQAGGPGLKCWGENTNGQLGYGDTARRGDSPGEMASSLPQVDLGSSLPNISVLAAGSSSACAVFEGNTGMKCWGANLQGQLGYGDTITRGDDPGEMGDALAFVDLGLTTDSVIRVSIGASHVCAVMSSGGSKCWGSNAGGQLGLGDTNGRGDEAGEMGTSLAWVNLGTGKNIIDVAAGGFHTCFHLSDLTIKCFGFGFDGQLGSENSDGIGDDPFEQGDNVSAVNLGTNRTVIAVTAGDSHNCVVLDDLTTKCFGGSFQGQLGYGDTSSRGDTGGSMGDNLPVVDLGTGRMAHRVASGQFFTCAELDDESVKCWGAALSGLGYGDVATRGDAPGEMGDALPTIDVGPGANVSCTPGPTMAPSASPTWHPTSAPSPLPSATPSSAPTAQPTQSPSSQPTAHPTQTPSSAPSGAPSLLPTGLPTPAPTFNGSQAPSAQPTAAPSDAPTTPLPTQAPTAHPTPAPSSQPSAPPTSVPTAAPTSAPSSAPTAQPTQAPSSQPTAHPTQTPSTQPSAAPTSPPTSTPSTAPTTMPTAVPSNTPSLRPTQMPTTGPTAVPTSAPTTAPSISPQPTGAPTPAPTSAPTVTPNPTLQPTAPPSAAPTVSPAPTMVPSGAPTVPPTQQPTAGPTMAPSTQPTATPSAAPTVPPTMAPTTNPTTAPTTNPTTAPTTSPQPTLPPTPTPTQAPTVTPQPTLSPTGAPTPAPTVSPAPTQAPSSLPTSAPSAAPTAQPTSAPSAAPTAHPTSGPTIAPTISFVPSLSPTAGPVVDDDDDGDDDDDDGGDDEDDDGSGSSSGLSEGDIASIAVGAALAVFLVLIVAVVIRRASNTDGAEKGQKVQMADIKIRPARGASDDMETGEQ